MKKRKLLFTIAALLCSVGAWGQNPGDDYTSFIINPTFTDNANGWVIDGQARYYNGKGFDGTTNFIELANWGSSWDATISQTINSLPNGYYCVKAAGQMSESADCWMKLVANGAESFFSRNDVTNGNILANGTETEIGSGVAGWRYNSVIAKVTNGTLEISVVGHSDVSERWANFDHVTLTFLGSEIPDNTDVTDFINNWDFWGCFNNDFNGWTIETSGGNTWVHGNTAVEFWNNYLAATFDYYQTITNIPNGRYQISASMWSTQGTPNGNCGVYGTSNDVTKFAGVTDDCDDSNLHTYTTDGILVTNSTLRVGVKNNGERSSNWFGVDWIKLTYIGNNISYYSPSSFTSGDGAAAETWYEFDIANGGTYKVESSTATTIYYSQDNSDNADETASAAIAASGNITLGLAAGKLYFKSSAASTITITSLVPDGTYYLYDATHKLFLSRGATYGTRATVDKYGIPFTWTASPGLISFVDWADTYMFFDQNDHAACWLYTDGAAERGGNRLMAFTDAGDGKVYLQDAAKAVFIKHDNDVLTVPGTTPEGAAVWTIMTVAEHNAIVDVYPADNMTNVITAASMATKTRADGFETYLSTYYDANDVTSKIGTASFGDKNTDSGSARGNWNWTPTRGENNDNYRYGTAWVFEGNGAFTQTISASDGNLPAGIYKVEMGGFDRHGTEALDAMFATNYGSLSTSYLKANNEQVRLKAWADVEGRPTASDTQAASINNGSADNVAYVYLDGSTDLVLKVCKPTYLANCYFNFGNFRLTRYTLKDAVDADYTTLNTAISVAETHTLGFESGEYAPYNNIGALTSLATAKAIDQEAANTKETVYESVNALGSATWTANDGDVECVYNGDFSQGSWGLGGWSRPSSWGKNLPSDEPNVTVDKLKAAGSSTGSAYYNQQGTLVYGDTDSYTMPLKAKTIYTLTFKYASYQGGEEGDAGSNDGITVSILNESNEGMNATEYDENNNIYTDPESFVTKTIKFVTGAAGNYVLTLANSGNTVITDVSITKAANQYLEFADGSVPTYAPGTYPTVKISRTMSANRWATAIYPFAIPLTTTGIDDIAVLNSYVSIQPLFRCSQ